MQMNKNIIFTALVAGSLGTGLGRFTIPLKSEKLTGLEKSTEHNEPRSSRSNNSSYNPSSKRTFSDANSAKIKLFHNVGGSDFEKLALLALESKDELNRGAFLHVLFSEWARKEPMGALAFAQEHNRTDLVYEGLRQLGEVDAQGAFQWISENVKNVTAHGHLASAVFRGLVAVDPELAVSEAENFASGPQRDQLLFMTVDEWAKHDIQAVFSWLETKTLSPLISGIHEQVIGRYIDESPQEASQLIDSMPDGESKANYASRAIFQLAKEDIQSAISWTESMEGDTRNFALMGLVEQWAAGEDGMQALDYITDNVSSSNRDEIMTMAAMKLSQNNPEGLKQSLSSMSENDQLIAAKQLAQVYSVAMPEKSDEWLASLADGPVRDAAIKSSLNAYRNSDISKAFDLSATISNESERVNEVKQVMLEWIPLDQETAVRALEDIRSISRQEKEAMLEQIYQRVEIREYLLPPE